MPTIACERVQDQSNLPRQAHVDEIERLRRLLHLRNVGVDQLSKCQEFIRAPSPPDTTTRIRADTVHRAMQMSNAGQTPSLDWAMERRQ